MILLAHHNTIYMGSDMDDSLGNPIQSEEAGVRIDIQHKAYYPEEDTAQTVIFDDGTIIYLQYDGVLPYIPVRRPTPEEIEHCQRLNLTAEYEWNPFHEEGNFSLLEREEINRNYPITIKEYSDPISNILSYDGLEEIVSQQLTKDIATNVSSIKSKYSPSLTPKELSKLWRVGLKTAQRTLLATTHKCMRTTGLLAKRFKTDKAQLQYKQLSKRYGGFYVDFLKTGVKSVRQFIGGTLYTNKLGFKKFFPCTNETSEETGSTLRSFIELVGLPASLHSDNHGNFKEGLFKRLLRRFGILSTYTEPYSPW